MAMKKDDDKSKRTLSGKKPATFGGANSKLIKPKPTALTSPGPRATPSRPMGKDATGERNWDKSTKSRATVSVGPATLSMGGKTSKSTGGMNMTGYKENKKDNPMAKSSSGNVAPSTIQGSEKVLEQQRAAAKKSRNIALGIGGTMLGAGIAISGKKIGQKIGQAAKYIANTKERKTAKRAQKAENDAIIVERNKGKSTVKASKSTMKKLRGQ